MALANATKLFTYKFTRRTNPGAGSATKVPVPFGHNTIELPELRYVFARCNCTGKDLRFTDKDGSTALDYELVEFTPDNLRLEAWIETSIEQNAASWELDVYVLDDHDTASASGVGPFKAANGFKAVYHHADNDDATVWVDSSDNNLDLDSITGNAVRVASRMGYAQDLSGDYGQTGFFTDFNAADYSLESYHARDVQGSPDCLISMGDNVTNKGLHLEYNTDNTIKIGHWTNDLSSTLKVSDVGVYHHLMATHDQSASRARKLYLDGVEIGSDLSTGDLNVTNQDLAVGRNRPGANNNWDGQIAETRLHTAHRSAEWVSINAQMIKYPKECFSTDLTVTELGWHSYVEFSGDTTSLTGGSVTYFPVPLFLDSGDADNMFTGVTKAQALGGDLVALISTDTALSQRLPLDIRRYEQANKKMRAFARVPSNINNTTFTIRLYFSRGNTTQPDIDDEKGREDVMPEESIGCWPLNQATGSNAVDHSRHNRDGNHNGNPQQTELEFDYGQDFDDAGTPIDRFNVGDYPHFEGENTGPPTAVSYSAWVKLTNLNNNHTIVGKRDNGSPNEGMQWFVQSNGEMRFVLDRSSSQIDRDSAGTLSAGTIYHVMVTYDGSGNASGIHFYINGALSDASASGSITQEIGTGEQFTIGAENNSNNDGMDGVMQEIRAYGAEKIAEWAKLEFELIRNYSTYFTIGTVTSIGKTPGVDGDGWRGEEVMELQPECRFGEITTMAIVMTEKSFKDPRKLLSTTEAGGVRIIQDGAQVPQHVVVWEDVAGYIEIHARLDVSKGWKLLYDPLHQEQELIEDQPNGSQQVYPNDVLTIHFEDTGTLVITDSSPNQLDGTWNQEIDRSYLNDNYRSQNNLRRASSEYGSIPDNALFDVDAGEDFTMLGICTFDSVDGADLEPFAWKPANGVGYELEIENAVDEKIWFMVNGTGGGVIKSDFYPVVGQTYILVGKREKGIVSFWINGIKQSTTLNYPNVISGSGVMSFGRDPVGLTEYHDGSLEEFRLLVGTAICDDEIKTFSKNYLDPEGSFIKPVDDFDLIDCCKAILSIVLGNLKNLRLLFRKQEKHDQRFQNLYSAIRDIRREQLRGRREPNK